MALDLPGVGLGGGAVDDRDRAAADDLHDVVGADDAGGVLVDAEPEQRRVLGDQRQQPPEPVPLLEVLVDDDAGQHPETRRDLGHPVLRRRAGRAERDHVRRHRRRPGRRPGDDRAVPEPLEDRVGEPRPADRRGEPELVAAGQEDAGRVADREGRRLVVRLWPGHRVERPNVGDAELGEDLAVALAGLGAEDAGGRDDGDRRVPAARERDEPVEDHPVADLVLRPADDDDGPVAHCVDRLPFRSFAEG